MKDSKVNTVNCNKCVQNERQQGKPTSKMKDSKVTSVCKMKDSKVNTVNYNKCVQNERQQGKHSEL